jgi:hypothetical protein
MFALRTLLGWIFVFCGLRIAWLQWIGFLDSSIVMTRSALEVDVILAAVTATDVNGQRPSSSKDTPFVRKAKKPNGSQKKNTKKNTRGGAGAASIVAAVASATAANTSLASKKLLKVDVYGGSMAVGGGFLWDVVNERYASFLERDIDGLNVTVKGWSAFGY